MKISAEHVILEVYQAFGEAESMAETVLIKLTGAVLSRRKPLVQETQI